MTAPRGGTIRAGVIHFLLLLGGTEAASAGDATILPLAVRTPHGGYNRLVVSVTVCAPGTSRCARIDDVMVDTGSTGLRLEPAAVLDGLGLPPFKGSAGAPLSACVHFAGDMAWGPLVRADVRLGGLTARDLPVQLFAGEETDPPAACPRSTVRPTSNGTLGIGPHRLDCLGRCAQSPAWPLVFAREDGAWALLPDSVPPEDRLPNPLTGLHVNGVSFDLPPTPSGGAVEVTGTLTLGVGAVAESGPDPAHILRVGPAATFPAAMDDVTYADSYIDSGTEPDILPDAHLTHCADDPGLLCAEPPRRVAISLTDRDGVSVPVSVMVGDSQVITARRFGASDRIAVPIAQDKHAIVLGAPFFLGRRVAVVLDGARLPGRDDLVGPFYAFTAARPEP